MIHIFDGCKKLFELPGKACSACISGCQNCDAGCREHCKPCVDAAESCNDSLSDILNRPLGGYVFMASWLSIIEMVFCGYSLQYTDQLVAHGAQAAAIGNTTTNTTEAALGCVFVGTGGKQVGIINWLYVQFALAAIHMLFAFYVQCRLWSKLKESAGDVEADAPMIVSQDKVKECFVHIFLHDIGVCVYVFTLIGSLVWSLKGTEWTLASACNPDGYPGKAAGLGCFFFWFVLIYAIGWYSNMNCLAVVGEGLVIKGPKQAYGHPAPGVVTEGAPAYQQVPEAEPMEQAPAASEESASSGSKLGGTLGGLLAGAKGMAAKVLPGGQNAASSSSSAPTPAAQPAAQGPPPKLTSIQRACRPRQFAKLGACIGLDVAGNATYLFPGLGESVDLAYAPAQAVALKMMFDANGVMLVGLAEELLPFTDIFPSATIAWCLETFAPESPLSRLFGIR